MSLGMFAGPTITKDKTSNENKPRNEAATDTTTVIGFDGYNTVEIDFNKESDGVKIKIYQRDSLVYEDTDNVKAGTTLCYTIGNTKDKVFDIVVESNGKEEASESIMVHY